MKNYLFSIFIFILLIPGICNADEIFLIDGSSAKTKIIDTSGCDIKIVRNNIDVTIRKKNVEKVILGNDTIQFANFVCNETVRQAVNYNETPEYKLKELIDNSVLDSHALKDNGRMAYLYMPIDGNYNLEEFAGIQIAIIDLLKQQVSTKLITSDIMLGEFYKSTPQFDYALIARQYHVFVDRSRSKPSIFNIPDPMFGGFNNPVKMKMSLYTICDFDIYDLKKKCIIFHYKNTVKRTITREHEYEWSKVFTSKEWQHAYTTNRKEHVSDKNASSIKEDLLKDLSEYFHLN